MFDPLKAAFRYYSDAHIYSPDFEGAKSIVLSGSMAPSRGERGKQTGLLETKMDASETPTKQQVLVTKSDFSANRYRLVELNADVEAAIKAGDKWVHVVA